MEFQQIEFRTNLQAFPKFGNGDAKQGGDCRFVSRVDQIDCAGKAFAVGQRIKGLTVFGGGHARSLPDEVNSVTDPMPLEKFRIGPESCVFVEEERLLVEAGEEAAVR